jgi:hypothetical protein
LSVAETQDDQNTGEILTLRRVAVILSIPLWSLRCHWEEWGLPFTGGSKGRAFGMTVQDFWVWVEAHKFTPSSRAGPEQT